MFPLSPSSSPNFIWGICYGSECLYYKYVTRLVNLLKDSLETDCWDKFKIDEEDVFMEFYDYFDNLKIIFNDCDEFLDKKIRENIVVFENENLKQRLIEEICKNKNYKKLFEEIK